MDSQPRRRMPAWPFFLADLVLLTFAVISMLRAGGPNTPEDRLIWIGTVCVGCFISLVPFIYGTTPTPEAKKNGSDDPRWDDLKAAVETAGEKLPQTLGPRLDQMQLEILEKFSGIEGGMAASRKSFEGLIAALNQQQSVEASHARLEAEKLRKGEGEWLQLTAHLMDQAFALFQAAANSGQQAVAQQLGLYYSHCRDLVRRKGLVPLLPEPGSPFRPEEQMVSEGTPVSEESRIGIVLAPGYTYQKQMVRKALVTLAQDSAPETEPGTVVSEPETESAEASSKQEDAPGSIIQSELCSPGYSEPEATAMKETSSETTPSAEITPAPEVEPGATEEPGRKEKKRKSKDEGAAGPQGLLL